jgi:hypothetical protein
MPSAFARVVESSGTAETTTSLASRSVVESAAARNAF